MKIARSILSAVIAVLLVVCASHTIISYITISNEPYNALPASTAFLLIIPYSLTIAVCVVAWVVVNTKYNKANR